ncbi:S-methyl-5-thioribose kinase [Paenibacillus apiarius]|uniref:S-methyl-5-thioribose kinase n=1 Tax=Paenibacillus apiarius TaxID=46240 RepID=A0ABT4DMQ2_9BACL|nr:S-methyl-5-thioribose kinase [Paenibacillus apiarius]MCY9514641.1 S-methyl-5-thioribose kinase [Paenibacillus apiarius]MCY9518631.1 S-methyl-5-thioribose kinase [Paenibacillus apiarius]MCY9552719.1 S-methyl-5-thioribose kinase [Paenibacillus apiarius]MCY9556953.1 S-methyl-5-thioribose kinase [Paenibacillus apiarius]MCY9686094.1 S-methyl-5-thioribose kinase [Paenibacillus apiarius]
MNDFNNYFTMKESDVINYAISQLDFFAHGAVLSCKEIGDGNLNYVFRVVDENTRQSLIIKQAGPVARISDEFKVSPDRNRIESEILKIEYDLAPGLVPQIYKYDAIMNCCVMEDLSDHEILRTALLKHKQFPLFAEHISTFMVNTLLLTTDVVMNHKEKKRQVKDFINPDLCEITEDLVYTEPFYDCPRNDVYAPLLPFAKEYLWEDEALLLETAKLKFEFMSNAQSLIHGDLHTGSIFVKPDSTKVIDPEFAFYGPAGYDVGNVIANLIFAYVNADSVMEEGTEKERQKDWLLSTIQDIIDLFKEKFLVTWAASATDKCASYKGFDRYYLDLILRDTAGVAGLELCRRTLGLAHVKDITSIADPAARARAEKMCIVMGKRFIMERTDMKSGADFVRVIVATADEAYSR